MEFYIGDRVRAIRDEKVLEKIGVVVTVDNGITGIPYLVDFEDFHEGRDWSDYYNEPWFPESAKKPGIRSYRWMRGHELKLISREGQGNEEKTGEREKGKENNIAAVNLNRNQHSGDVPPSPPPIHDSAILNALTQLCEEQEGVTDILAFQRAGCRNARELYAEIGGLILEGDGYGRRKYHNLPGLSPAYCNLLTQLMMGEHQSAAALRGALEHTTQNATQEHHEAKTEDAAHTASENAKTRAPQNALGELETLFDQQLATLKARGVDEEILDKFRSMKETVLSKAMDIWERHGFAPIADLAEHGIHLFLPVITEQYLDYDRLMRLVQSYCGAGVNRLGEVAIIHNTEAPSDFYYIYDVEDGTAISGETLQKAKRLLALRQRSSLTIPETISLCTLTGVLHTHKVYAAGSQSNCSYYVPAIAFSGGSQQELCWCHIEEQRDGRWVVPSCLCRQ